VSEKKMPECSCGAILNSLMVYEEFESKYVWNKPKFRYERSEGVLSERKVICPNCGRELPEKTWLGNL